MAKKKIVMHPNPFRIESGQMLELRCASSTTWSPVDAGYDLFDRHQLERLKEDFVNANETRFQFTYESGPLKGLHTSFCGVQG
jgi:hypothetical protein